MARISDEELGEAIAILFTPWCQFIEQFLKVAFSITDALNLLVPVIQFDRIAQHRDQSILVIVTGGFYQVGKQLFVELASKLTS